MVTTASRMIISKHSLLVGSQSRLPWKSIRDNSKLPGKIMSGFNMKDLVMLLGLDIDSDDLDGALMLEFWEPSLCGAPIEISFYS